MFRPIRTQLAIAALLTLAACGGAGTGPNSNPPAPPPPPPAPTPVASVSVTPAQASLVPLQTQALTATTLDASGNTLTGRAVTWTTSASAVATVSSDGLVTAVGPGAATITATSESKTGSAAVTVADGGHVTPAGGTFTAADGAVKITVPAGAVGAPVAITVTAETAPPTGLPDGTYGVVGTSFTFGPEGTTFSAPVTVTVKYDPAKKPVWALPTDLALYHFTGGAWVELPNLVVDSAAHTVTAETNSFSPFTVGTNLPQGALTPAIGSVNFIQRSVVFTASIPGHPSTGLTYAWTGTGRNGVISPLFGADAQYTMTQPQLPPGDLDQVQVIIRGNIDPTMPNVLVPLASAEATINANLQFTYEVNPDDSEPDFGATQALRALIRNADGSIYQNPANLPVLMVWNSSQFHGDLDIHNPNHKTDVDRGVYTAKTAAQSAQLPPRVDQVTVDFYVGYYKDYTTTLSALGFTRVRVDSTVARFDVKNGSAQAFLEVAPRTLLANFTVRTIPTPGGACKTADAIIPKVTGATSYDLTVTGIVGSSLGTSIHKVVTGVTNMGNILDVYDGGVYFGVPLDGGCNTTQAGITARENIYRSQYGGASFVVKTSP
jgi:hypothetical protein